MGVDYHALAHQLTATRGFDKKCYDVVFNAVGMVRECFYSRMGIGG